MDRLAKESCLMHQFLRDAANIDASSSKPPFRTLRRRSDVVEYSDFSSEFGSFFRSS